MEATALNPNRRNQGMNWITPKKRLAIYLRDGLACVYCQASVEQGTKLSLDHLTPSSKGGSNKESNLVTCCSRCNSSRGARPWRQFAKAVAEYVNHGVTAEAIIQQITKTTRRNLPLAQAAELIAQRGGFTAALKS
jgi:hypothetical protein